MQAGCIQRNRDAVRTIVQGATSQQRFSLLSRPASAAGRKTHPQLLAHPSAPGSCNCPPHCSQADGTSVPLPAACGPPCPLPAAAGALLRRRLAAATDQGAAGAHGGANDRRQERPGGHQLGPGCAWHGAQPRRAGGCGPTRPTWQLSSRIVGRRARVEGPSPPTMPHPPARPLAEEAAKELRKKGLAAASKKAARHAAEGLVGIAKSARAAAVVEVRAGGGGWVCVCWRGEGRWQLAWGPLSAKGQWTGRCIGGDCCGSCEAGCVRQGFPHCASRTAGCPCSVCHRRLVVPRCSKPTALLDARTFCPPNETHLRTSATADQ